MIKKKLWKLDDLKSVRALQNSNNYEIVNAWQYNFLEVLETLFWGSKEDSACIHTCCKNEQSF